MSGSARISPTAHYTARVWLNEGLSHDALCTWQGRALHLAVRPVQGVARLVGGANLDALLLARHRGLDARLEAALDSGQYGQVVEVAAGLSPRGLRTCHQRPDITYIEADLPGMAAHKSERLARVPGQSPRHKVIPVDLLATDGPLALGNALAPHLDPAVGTVVITEGLLPYFDRPTVELAWRRIQGFLSGFPRGRYLAELHMQRDLRGSTGARAFVILLGWFARGRVHVHYEHDDDALVAVRAAGFTAARIYQVPGHGPEVRLVQVLEADLAPEGAVLAP